jgi:hypothetical protein
MGDRYQGPNTQLPTKLSRHMQGTSVAAEVHIVCSCSGNSFRSDFLLTCFHIRPAKVAASLSWAPWAILYSLVTGRLWCHYTACPSGTGEQLTGCLHRRQNTFLHSAWSLTAVCRLRGPYANFWFQFLLRCVYYEHEPYPTWSLL